MLLAATVPAYKLCNSPPLEALISGVAGEESNPTLSANSTLSNVLRDQLRRIEIKLAVEPVPPPFQDVGTLLLQCMCGLLANVQPWPRSQSLRAAAADAYRARRLKTLHHIVQRDVLALIDHADDEIRILIEARSAFPSLRAWRQLADLRPGVQRIALATPTPKRAAAERADAPSADAFRTRDRKSSPSARAIVHLHQGEP